MKPLISFLLLFAIHATCLAQQHEADVSHTTFKSAIDFGLSFPTLQYGFGAKRLNLMYVPGVYGSYHFAKKMSATLTLQPYVRYPTSEDNVNTLYLTRVDSQSIIKANTFSVITAYQAHAGIHYGLSKKFGVEAAAGYLHAYGGKGKIITAADDPGFTIISEEKSRYGLSDIAFLSVKKSMVYYQLQLWYSMQNLFVKAGKKDSNTNELQFGFAWQHNNRGWTDLVKADNYLQLSARISLAAALKKRS